MPTSNVRSGRVILGIDPGYADAGYGVIREQGRNLTYINCDNIRTAPQEGFPKRLLALSMALEKLILTYKPKLIAVEKLFFFKNLKTAIDVAQARGVILLKAAEHRIPIVEFTPLQVKQSLTSYGLASKEQVALMVKRLLRVPKLIKKDDAIDALAIAICAAFHRRQG